MENHPQVQTTSFAPSPIAELDRPGQEIAELSAPAGREWPSSGRIPV